MAIVSAAGESASAMPGTRLRRIFLGVEHATLRQFEAKLVAHLGYELFVPKTLPQDGWDNNAPIGYDATLTIPRDDLEILNAQDYYDQPLGALQIELLNRHFDAAIITYSPLILDQFVRFFRGKILLRPLGLAKGQSYTDACRDDLPPDFTSALESARNRIMFAQAFPAQSSNERGIFLNRAVTLPAGLPDATNPGSWSGAVPKLLFVCPGINSSANQRGIYEKFKKKFGDYPHLIAGAQPIVVADDASVAGFVPRETLNEWMRSHRVMYCQSTDPERLQYHPLEAMQAGMPVVFHERVLAIRTRRAGSGGRM